MRQRATCHVYIKTNKEMKWAIGELVGCFFLACQKNKAIQITLPSSAAHYIIHIDRLPIYSADSFEDSSAILGPLLEVRSFPPGYHIIVQSIA